MSENMYELVISDKRKYPIKLTGLTIGYNPSNDIVINDSQVADIHARILNGGGRIWVRDENTKSGIYINGQRIAGQQEINIGDELKIGRETFKLKLVPATSNEHSRSRRGIVIVLITSAFLLLFILLIGTSGSIKPELVFMSVTTNTTTPTTSLTTTFVNSVTLSTSVMVTGVEATVRPTPSFNASITCDDINDYKDIHTCLVKNLGIVKDTLWLGFTPHRIDTTNNFNLSVIIKGEQNTIFADRKGKISLGEFKPGTEKNILVQMICVDVFTGCPSTTIKVQLFANEGKYSISSPAGIFSITNRAFGKTVTPTSGSMKITQPTEIPSTLAPTLTNTPSDAYGPTPSPKP